ncbi:MAG: lamin tail domain-containing protein [Myxococcota bacterium]
MSRHVLVVLAGLNAGCLPSGPPDAPPMPRDLSRVELGSPDAAPPFGLSGVSVEDANGRPWPPGATPRRPIVRIEATRPWAAGTEAWLFRDTLSEEELREDLDRAPARVATLATVLALAGAEGATLLLRPDEPLALGATLRWAVPAWAEDAAGTPLGAASVGTLRVAESDAGAVLLATWPPSGAAGVPATLAEAAFHFDDALATLEGLGLEGPEGAVAASAWRVPCGALGWAKGECVVLDVVGPLGAGAYAFVVGAETRDRTGAPLGPLRIGFRVGDPAPLALVALPCVPAETSIAELCALADDDAVVLRLAATAPARVTLRTEGAEVRSTAPRGEATLVLEDLGNDRSVAATLELVGLGGATLQRALELRTTPPLAPVALTEICSDPLGREPKQEWVELLNYGTVPVALDAFTLADRADAPGDALPARTLAPGGRALLVADAFDPAESPEPVPAGVPLLRLGTSLASGGLTNAGEPIYLRDAEGRRLGAAPARATGPGLCLRNAEPTATRTGRWSIGPCTPGAP